MQIKLWNEPIPYFISDAETPNYMTTYLIDTDKPLPCIVIYPGGGYHKRAYHEGEPVAEFFNRRGFHAVVAEYRVAPNRDPAPLADAQRAVKLVRYHADEWKIDPNRIVTLGFSAGGHLCASTLVCDEVIPEGHTPDAIDAMPHRPNGGILCYPVISVESDYGHTGSGKNLLGERYETEKAAYNLSKKVTEDTPKAFLWHTSDDASVNVKNSLIFAERMRDAGIPFELHVFPHGKHGLGLAPDHADIRQWADLAADWVERNI